MFIPQWINNSILRGIVPKSMIPLVKRILPYIIKNNNINDIVGDILIPFTKMRDFYEWYNKEIGVYPVYICPAQSDDKFTFWKKDLLVDFGVGYGVETDNAVEKMKRIEQKLLELNGKKLLYAKTNMSEEEFWSLYDREAYNNLREKYHSRFPQLYEKVTR